MQALRQYILPIKGLDVKVHQYTFEVDDSFFEEFENSPIHKGQITTELVLEKKYDNLVLSFTLNGKVKTECDRCTAIVDFPIESENELIIKYDENPREDGDVIYIHPDENEINIATYLYDNIILSLPIIKVFDCESEQPKPCNEEVLKYLDKSKTENSSLNNPFGEALKQVKIKTK